jgi:chromosome segregation ATPase
MSKAQSKEQQAYPELKAVLDHQELIAGLSQNIQSIDTAITDQEAKLTAARERRPSTDALEQRRQDLFAAEALGQITEGEREARESEIDREAAEIKERWASVDQSIVRMEAALNSLRGQRESASEQLRAAQALTTDVIEPLLVAEGEKVCAAYVEVAEMVKERYLQLMSLSNILQQATSNRRKPRHLRGWNTNLFFIPSFSLPQCMDMVHPKASGKLFYAENLDYGDAENEERARLHALGINLI